MIFIEPRIGLTSGRRALNPKVSCSVCGGPTRPNNGSQTLGPPATMVPVPVPTRKRTRTLHYRLAVGRGLRRWARPYRIRLTRLD